jgi:hypothetical protein
MGRRAEPPAMFGSLLHDIPTARGLVRIQDWTRERFQLDKADPVVVTELRGRLPGYPPLQTVVAFWTADGQRHQFRVFKPADQVLPEDLPYGWMKASLAVPYGYACECC